MMNFREPEPSSIAKPMTSPARAGRRPIGAPKPDSQPAVAPTNSRPSGRAKPIDQPAGNGARQPIKKPKPASAAAAAPDLRFIDPLVLEIRGLWRRRQVWHRAEKSLTHQASAICRSFVGMRSKGDKAGLAKAAALLKSIEADEGLDTDVGVSVLPLLMPRAELRPHREAVEKVLEGLAAQLPIADVVNETRGLGLLGLAGIIGEAGAVGEYRTVSGLWKRMGVAVIGGERQRCKSDVEQAEAHGYSPSRRSVMWNVGQGLIGAMGHGPRPRVGEDVEACTDWSEWQKMFVQRLRFEAARDEDMVRPPVEKNGVAYESYSAHAAARARRYVEKQFLRRLWCRWRSIQQPTIRTKPETGSAADQGRRPIEGAKPTGESAAAPLSSIQQPKSRSKPTKVTAADQGRRPIRPAKSESGTAVAPHLSSAHHSIETQRRNGR
jgi:hypothetical protein